MGSKENHTLEVHQKLKEVRKEDTRHSLKVSPNKDASFIMKRESLIVGEWGGHQFSQTIKVTSTRNGTDGQKCLRRTQHCQGGSVPSANHEGEKERKNSSVVPTKGPMLFNNARVRQRG